MKIVTNDIAKTNQTRSQNSRIGEVLVELELLKRGWHVERLDGAVKTVNGDLIAIRGECRPVIQVKSALSWKRPFFGHAGPFLKDGKHFFNKDNPVVQADYLVTVCDFNNPIFHVFDIEEAESLAQKQATEWYAKPKKDGGQRSRDFPLSFSPNDERMIPHLSAWDLLIPTLPTQP